VPELVALHLESRFGIRAEELPLALVRRYSFVKWRVIAEQFYHRTNSGEFDLVRASSQTLIIGPTLDKILGHESVFQPRVVFAWREKMGSMEVKFWGGLNLQSFPSGQ
jgi:hypothetical protein